MLRTYEARLILAMAEALLMVSTLIAPHAYANDTSTKTAAPKTAKLTQAQAGYYRMKVGKIDMVVLSDGSVGLDVTNGLVLNEKPGEIESLLKRNFESANVDTSVNAFLLHIDGKWILIDAGASELVGPSAGKLPDSLRASGVKPEEISDIYITHIHPDHAGGLMQGKTMIFPNATVHIDSKEVAFWLNNKAVRTTADEHLKALFEQADAKVKPYADAGRLQPFEGGSELLPGLRSQPAYGHTPGHRFYVLENDGEKIIFWGDLIHVCALQFEDPGLAVGFDVDSAKAIDVRKKAFADAAAERYMVAADHLPFPGCGHVGKEGDHYRWVPVPYINDAMAQSVQTSK